MMMRENRRMTMTNPLDGRQVPPHGMFFMESAGGYHSKTDEVDEKHQPSCFALEEEKGETWTGVGASRPVIIETKPTL
jgi:hypothetical protein